MAATSASRHFFDDGSNDDDREDGRRASVALPWGLDDMHIDEVRALCRDVVAARQNTRLTHEELHRVLNAFGLPILPALKALSEDQVAGVASVIGFPVVVKLASPVSSHSSEACAALNVTNEAAARDAFRQLAARFPEALRRGSESAIVVQPMIIGAETLIRVTTDPLCGRLLVFGLGLQTDLLREVAFRLAPSFSDTNRGVKSSWSPPGGVPSIDVEALRDVLRRVSAMSASILEIQDIVLDPLIALPAGHGCRIADAMVSVGTRRLNSCCSGLSRSG
jgi:hypothetical protein